MIFNSHSLGPPFERTTRREFLPRGPAGRHAGPVGLTVSGRIERTPVRQGGRKTGNSIRRHPDPNIAQAAGAGGQIARRHARPMVLAEQD